MSSDRPKRHFTLSFFLSFVLFLLSVPSGGKDRYTLESLMPSSVPGRVGQQKKARGKVSSAIGSLEQSNELYNIYAQIVEEQLTSLFPYKAKPKAHR
jgi:hypothetical protein